MGATLRRTAPRRAALALALAALIVAGAARAGDTVEVSASLTPPALPFHRSASYSIVVEAPAAVLTSTPEMPLRIGTLEVRRQEPLTVGLSGGRLRTMHTWLIDPVSPGDFVIVAPLVTWEGGEARPAPLALHVRDLSDAEREAAERFTGLITPEGLPPANGGVPWWAVLGALIVMAAVAALLYRRLARVPAPPAPLPPWEVAARRLRELAQRQLPGQGRHEAYYVDLSSILRYYLEDRFALHAPEQTTQEFLETAASSGRMLPDQQDFLADFLRHSDRVKFARHEPTGDEMAAHFAGVEAFVRDTTPRPEAAAPPQPPETAREAAA